MKRGYFFRTSKIAVRVILAFLLLVVFQGIVTIAGVSIIVSRSSRESFENRMSGTVSAVAAYIDDVIRDVKVKTSLLAGQKKVIDYTDFGLANLLKQELTVYRLPMKIGALCVLREDSSVVASSGEPWVVGLARENRMVRNFLEGTPVFFLNAENRLYLWCLSPVLREKTVVGYLAAAVHLDNTFLRPLESATGARVMLSLRNQAFASTGLPDSVTIHILANYYRKPMTSQSDVSGHVGSFVYRAAIIPSQPDLYAYSFLDTGFYLGLLRQYNAFALIFLFLVIVLAAILAGVFYRVTFMVPLVQFMDGVKRVAEGDLDHTIDRRTEDEFGDLAKAFEHMTESLRERERRIVELGRYNALILANVPAGILTLDLEGRVSGFNPRFPEILSLAADGISSGRGLEELSLPDEVTAAARAALDRGEYTAFREIVIADGEGEKRSLSLAVNPFSSEDNVRIGVLAVLVDVTRERSLEQKLALSSRMAAIGEMVAGVAHQIRTPLAIMKVSAEMLRDSSLPDPGAAKLARMIIDEIDSLGAVVSCFLDFTRPLTVRKEPCDVRAFVEKAVSFLPLERFPEVGLDLVFGDGPDGYPLDASLIREALSNLVMNALEVSRPGSRVGVAAGLSEGRLVIEVRDRGPGMPPEVRKNIFNPFFTTKTRGTGLGLSIAKRIVECHGGSLEFASAEGEGTTFRMTL